MTRCEQAVRQALESEGIALPGWKIDLKVAKHGYQFELLEAIVYEPRKRKPSCAWEIMYDSFRQLVLWSDSNTRCTYYRDTTGYLK